MIYTIFDISIIKMIVTSNVDVDVEKCVQNQNNYYNIYYNNSTFILLNGSPHLIET